MTSVKEWKNKTSSSSAPNLKIANNPLGTIEPKIVITGPKSSGLQCEFCGNSAITAVASAANQNDGHWNQHDNHINNQNKT